MVSEGSTEILLVEGDPSLQTALADALLGEGFRVRVAGSAEEALGAIGDGEVPLVVTEVGLPGQSGFDLARRLRDRDPTAEIVFLSGSEDPRLAVSAIRAGAGDYLVKHWDGLESLLRSIRAAESRREEARRQIEFLRDLADLNEGFLRQMVELEKENVDLQARLKGEEAAFANEELPFRVLVVDDEAVILTVVGNLLKDEGYEIQTATDAGEALTRLEAERFDLMIVDKNLPGMSGLDLIRRVKQLYSHIESILITGYGSLESAVEALHLGASGYLLKPFEDVAMVLGKVNELRSRQMERRRAMKYLQSFKLRNQDFIERYRDIRGKLQEFLGGR